MAIIVENVISHWPDHKKLAVLVTVMFEVWFDGKAPPYSPMTTSLKPGTPRHDEVARWTIEQAET